MCVIYTTKSSENFKNVAVGHTKEFEQNFGRREQNLPIYKWRKKRWGLLIFMDPCFQTTHVKQGGLKIKSHKHKQSYTNK